MNGLEAVFEILKHVPPFVWGILAYLLYVGIKALKPREVSVYRLTLIPLVLIALKYKILMSPDVWVYFVAIAVGVLVGFYKVKNDPIEILKERKSIRIPGSSSLIVILLGIFVVKYYFGYLQAVNPAAYARDLLWDFGISGVLSGYFMGQRGSYIYRYVKSSTDNSVAA